MGTAEDEEDCFRWMGQKQRNRKSAPRRRPKTEKEEDVHVEGPETVKQRPFQVEQPKTQKNERLFRVAEPKTETAGDCSSCKDQREKNKKTVTRRRIQTFLFKAYVELSQRNITRQSVRHIRLPKKKRTRRRKSTPCRSNFTAVGWNSCLI